VPKMGGGVCPRVSGQGWGLQEADWSRVTVLPARPVGSAEPSPPGPARQGLSRVEEGTAQTGHSRGPGSIAPLVSADRGTQGASPVPMPDSLVISAIHSGNRLLGVADALEPGASVRCPPSGVPGRGVFHDSGEVQLTEAIAPSHLAGELSPPCCSDQGPSPVKPDLALAIRAGLLECSTTTSRSRRRGRLRPSRPGSSDRGRARERQDVTT
jgi:hypothetical protein